MLDRKWTAIISLVLSFTVSVFCQSSNPGADQQQARETEQPAFRSLEQNHFFSNHRYTSSVADAGH